MKKFIILIFALSTALHSQTIKPHFDLTDKSLLTLDYSARLTDTISTRYMLSGCKCNHEDFLPREIVDRNATMIAYEVGFGAIDYFVARTLVNHHHNRIAKVFLIGESVSIIPFAIRNFTLDQVKPVHVSHPIIPRRSY